MSDTTAIEWATATWNPWEGCTKVSPGCAHCYAEARNQRFSGGANWGKGKPRRRTSAGNWKKPVKWNIAGSREQGAGSKRPRIFPSLCDWLDDEVPIEWLADFLKLIHECQNLDFLLLTKRPENFYERLERAATFSFGDIQDRLYGWSDGDEFPANVWLGVSVEDQQRADERIPELLKIPARVRFLSVEPLLGAVDLKLTRWVKWSSAGGPNECAHGYAAGIPCRQCTPNPDWVIVGGESGAGARPCRVEWIEDILAQCEVAGVPCFVKQLGRNVVGGEMQKWVTRIKHPKGGDPAEWPVDLRVRKFPLVDQKPMANSR